MNTLTDFDKVMDDLMFRRGDMGMFELKQAIKQAVDKYVIGNDVDSSSESLPSRTFYSIEGGNIVRKIQRQILWGDEQ